jgi:A/G-specific adenine glycosylase
MLQQTQVDRVVPLYKSFIKKFPTAKKLAAASLADVLKSWQGLGYNRRAKMLHAAANKLAISRSNLDIAGLEELPGVGPYTARAVAAFAYNQDSVVIETNIRTVIIHHFFADAEKVPDTEIESVLSSVLPKGKSREWYSALMDYGAYLKRSGISHNKRSSGYAKQVAFAGSLREVRGAILRELAKGSAPRARLYKLFGKDREEQVTQALGALSKEGMLVYAKGRYALAD